MYVLCPYDEILDAAIAEASEALPGASEDDITARACLIVAFWLDRIPYRSFRIH